MGIIMKFTILLSLSSVFLLACTSSHKVERYVHKATQAYYIHYGGHNYRDLEQSNGPTFFLNEIVNGNLKDIATNEQKAYAYMYLAKIELRKDKPLDAINLLEQSEQKSNLFPYRYELLADYYFKKGDFEKSKYYYQRLINWLNKRIKEVISGSFNLDKLEFMDIRSYKDGQFEDDYIEMYNKAQPKELRTILYLEYLSHKKKITEKQLTTIYTHYK